MLYGTNKQKQKLQGLTLLSYVLYFRTAFVCLVFGSLLQSIFFQMFCSKHWIIFDTYLLRCWFHCVGIFYIKLGSCETFGNRTIPPWTVTPRIITPQLIVPRTISSWTVTLHANGPPDNSPSVNFPLCNCPPDNYPPPSKIFPCANSPRTILHSITDHPEASWLS